MGYLQEHVVTYLKFEVPSTQICIAFLSTLCGEYPLLDFLHRCISDLNQLWSNSFYVPTSSKNTGV